MVKLEEKVMSVSYTHLDVYKRQLSSCVRDKRMAMALSKATGYPLAHAAGSAGGYKDWLSLIHI